MARGLLTVWRHKFASAAGAKGASFVPVRIDTGGGPGTADERGDRPASRSALLAMAARPAERRGAIEIEVSGARIRIEPGVDATTLATVLSLLREAP